MFIKIKNSASNSRIEFWSNLQRKAKKLIDEICDKNEVEFLPCELEGTDEQYYIFNILSLEDCVDYEKSKYKHYPSNPNKIMFF